MRGNLGTTDALVLNWIKRRGNPLPPVYENVAICMACGKESYVNNCGFCEDCWVTYAHLRRKGGEKTKNGIPKIR